MTTDLMIESQSNKNEGANKIMIPVLVQPGGLIHYSVDADEESIPLTFYQDVQTIRLKFYDRYNEELKGIRGQPIYLRFRFHMKY